MYTMTFVFSDGTSDEYSHLEKVRYFDMFEDGYVVLSGDKILVHDFPLNCDFQLFCGNTTYKVSCNGLKSIQVTKENN